jgi:hypothetical protein
MLFTKAKKEALKKHEGAANQYNATFADMQEKGEL